MRAGAALAACHEREVQRPPPRPITGTQISSFFRKNLRERDAAVEHALQHQDVDQVWWLGDTRYKLWRFMPSVPCTSQAFCDTAPIRPLFTATQADASAAMAQVQLPQCPVGQHQLRRAGGTMASEKNRVLSRAALAVSTPRTGAGSRQEACRRFQRRDAGVAAGRKRTRYRTRPGFGCLADARAARGAGSLLARRCTELRGPGAARGWAHVRAAAQQHARATSLACRVDRCLHRRDGGLEGARQRLNRCSR